MMLHSLPTSFWVSALIVIGQSETSLAEYSISEISFASSDANEQISYLLYTPDCHAADGPHPVAVSLYGAGGSIKDYNFSDASYADLRQALESRGYFIVVPDLGQVHFMNQTAVNTLDQTLSHVLINDKLDPSRICMIGTSMGGGSSLAYAIQRPQKVRAVVSHMGMSDFAAWWKESPKFRPSLEHSFGGSPNDRANEYAARSALANVMAFKHVPVFLVHGEADADVLSSQSEKLHELLQDNALDSQLVIVRGGSHANSTMRGLGPRIAKFLDASMQRGESKSIPDAKREQ